MHVPAEPLQTLEVSQSLRQQVQLVVVQLHFPQQPPACESDHGRVETLLFARLVSAITFSPRLRLDHTLFLERPWNCSNPSNFKTYRLSLLSRAVVLLTRKLQAS